MNAKFVVLMTFAMLATTLPTASAADAPAVTVIPTTSDAQDCTGHYEETPPGSGKYTCYGVCDNPRPNDSCVGACPSGGCYTELVCEMIETLPMACPQNDVAEEQATVNTETQSEADSDCYIGVQVGNQCYGVEKGCTRLIPETPIYNPLTGNVLYTIDIKTEVCI